MHYNFEGLSIQINGAALVINVIFLGIHINENLSWKRHISQLNSKIPRASFANQVNNVLPRDNIIFGLNSTHINYGILAWGMASLSEYNKHLTKTYITHNK